MGGCHFLGRVNYLVADTDSVCGGRQCGAPIMDTVVEQFVDCLLGNPDNLFERLKTSRLSVQKLLAIFELRNGSRPILIIAFVLK